MHSERVTEPRVIDAWQAVEALIISVAVVFALIGAQGYLNNDAVNSRLASVYSLVNFGTWRIDRPQDKPAIAFEQGTIDKVEVEGRLISSKPPMLPLMMAGEYIALHRVLGWDLDDEAALNKIARFMNFTLVGLAYIAAVVFFAKTLRLFVRDPLPRVVLLFSLAFGTQLWGYSTHLNNHVPATGLLVVAIYLAIGMSTGKLAPSGWRFAVFGLAAGLVPTLDVPAAIFVLPAGLFLLWRYPAKTLILAGFAATLPIAVHLFAIHAATGSFLPVQTRQDVYLYEGSYWRSPLGIDALNQPKGIYLLHMLIGRVGLFALFPVTFGGVLVAFVAMFRKSMPLRGYILAGGAAFLVLTAYYVHKTNNYGGEAYGFRWYIVAMPVLLLMAAPLFAAMKKRWQWMLASVLVGVSFYSAYECASSPWGSNHEWTVRLFYGPSYGKLK
jgi:hypothetical protein